MTAHAWVVETTDAGPLGHVDSWLCPMCGASGGPAWPDHVAERLTAKGVGVRWLPFIAGPAKRVSEDCDEARVEIRTYIIDERIAAIRKKWHADTGEHRHYASLLKDAIVWTPEATNLMPVLDLIYKIEMPVLTDNKRLSILDVRKALVDAGFCVTPRHEG